MPQLVQARSEGRRLHTSVGGMVQGLVAASAIYMALMVGTAEAGEAFETVSGAVVNIQTAADAFGDHIAEFLED